MAPSELYDVRSGSERLFMSPLSIRALPGVHRPCMRTVLKRLDDLNLRSLGDIADSPLEALEVVLGHYAGQLSRWAQGIDPTPVLPPEPIRPDDTITLTPDEVDDARLQGRLADSLQRLCRTLRSQRRMCGGLCLDPSLQRSSRSEHQGAGDAGYLLGDRSLRTAPGLFQRTFQRRIRLRLMTVTLTELTDFAEQGIAV
jgi:DNA polymerase-4